MHCSLRICEFVSSPGGCNVLWHVQGQVQSQHGITFKVPKPDALNSLTTAATPNSKILPPSAKFRHKRNLSSTGVFRPVKNIRSTSFAFPPIVFGIRCRSIVSNFVCGTLSCKPHITLQYITRQEWVRGEGDKWNKGEKGEGEETHIDTVPHRSYGGFPVEMSHRSRCALWHGGGSLRCILQTERIWGSWRCRWKVGSA